MIKNKHVCIECNEPCDCPSHDEIECIECYSCSDYSSDYTDEENQDLLEEIEEEI